MRFADQRRPNVFSAQPTAHVFGLNVVVPTILTHSSNFSSTRKPRAFKYAH
ncbi:Hypothetical protein A7982_02169 [Minicystis rosea]|nr:Hypothetical protein A7982_02169 [Minicystis rosea]